jgi:hypothetical protein
VELKAKSSVVSSKSPFTIPQVSVVPEELEPVEEEEEDEEEDEVTELDSDTPPHAAKNNVAKAVKVRALLVFIFLLFTLFDNNGHLGSN